jgi:hypothetical protein
VVCCSFADHAAKPEKESVENDITLNFFLLIPFPACRSTPRLGLQAFQGWCGGFVEPPELGTACIPLTTHLP